MSNAAWVKMDIRAMLEGLNGDILPSLDGSDSYSGDVYIRPSNISYAKISVVPPTIYTKRIYPTKDAYVDASNPIINYGSAPSIVVNANRYKSYMSFSMKDIPAHAIIESAKMLLYKENYTNNSTLDVSTTLNDYDEIGITSANAPAADQNLFSITLPDSSGYSSSDLQYYVMDWYANSQSTDRAFALTSTSTDPIILTSKEGGNQPYIEVQYYIENQNVGINEVYGEVYPICIRDYVMDAEIFVESNTREVFADGEINVIAVPGGTEFSGEIQAINSITMFYNAETNIIAVPGSVETPTNEIQPIVDRTVEFAGEINIIRQTEIVEEQGELLPLLSSGLETYGEINIKKILEQVTLDGEIIPSAEASIEYFGEVNMVPTTVELNFWGSFVPVLTGSKEYGGEINIIAVPDLFEFDGELLPEITATSEFVGEIDIELQVGQYEYDGELLPELNVVNEYNAETNIITQTIDINAYGETLPLFEVTTEFVGEINIITQTEEIDVIGEIYIKQITEQLDINGEIDPAILGYIYLNGEININDFDKVYGSVEYDGEVYLVRPTQGYVFIV